MVKINFTRLRADIHKARKLCLQGKQQKASIVLRDLEHILDVTDEVFFDDI